MSKLSLIGISRKNVSLEVDMSTVEGVIMHYSDLIITEAKANLKDSNATYSLSQSIAVEFELRTTKFGQEYVAVVKAEDYWQWVEDGRPPGKRPPLQNIIEWVRDKESFALRGKERIGETIKRGINKGRKVTLTDVVNQAANAIASNIGKYGTKGTKFLSRVLTDQFYADLNRDMSAALKKDIQVTIGAFKQTPDGKEFKRI